LHIYDLTLSKMRGGRERKHMLFPNLVGNTAIESFLSNTFVLLDLSYFC
jgi:hypothetical protein